MSDAGMIESLGKIAEKACEAAAAACNEAHQEGTP